MENQEQKTQERTDEVASLFEQRKYFIKVKADLARLIDEKIFHLQLENISNVRNSIIISGALATIGLIILESLLNIFPDISPILLQISVACFLLSILIYSFYLKETIGLGVKSFKDKIKGSIETATEGEDIINRRLDDKITKEVTENELREVFRKIEFEHIRTHETSAKKGDDKLIEFIGSAGNLLFSVGILSLISFFALMIISKLQ